MVEENGGWIFVSHSNRDIEKAREIRNELERRGHNPVLFFLKCMETTEADDRLLRQLIEREIKAREWFILCDSPNARNSAAVLREMELVKSMAREPASGASFAPPQLPATETHNKFPALKSAAGLQRIARCQRIPA